MIYVWFDALLNYYTALGYGIEGEGRLTERVLAAVPHPRQGHPQVPRGLWPAFLMAAGIELPKRMYIHGFLYAVEGHKMSKSLGNVLDPYEMIDQVRRRRAALLPVPRGLLRSGRPDLARGLRVPLRDRARNQYGNLANRMLSMIGRYRDGRSRTRRPSRSSPREFDERARPRPRVAG